MRVFTKSITSAITINNSDQIYNASIKANGGTVNILGNASFQGLTSTACTLNDGESVTLTAEVMNPLEGITITPSVAADIILTGYA